MLFHQILAYTRHEKSHTTTINLKYLGQLRMKNLNDLMDHILYQIFKINLSIKLHENQISIKKHETVTDNSPIRIYIDKIDNRISFKI